MSVFLRINTILIPAQESATSHVDLPDDNPVHIEAMLTFLYTGSSQPRNVPIIDFTDFTHAEVKGYLFDQVVLYAIGDKYGIPALCTNAALKVRGCLSRRNNPRELLFCVPLVYSSTPASDCTLRDSIIKYFQRLAPSIKARPQAEARLVRLMHTIEDFREDVTLALLECIDDAKEPIVIGEDDDVDSEQEAEDQDGMIEVS